MITRDSMHSLAIRLYKREYELAWWRDVKSWNEFGFTKEIGIRTRRHYLLRLTWSVSKESNAS